MSLKDTRSGTFVDNMKMPVHRWFRYSAGFSAEWVNTEILKFQEETGKKAILLDPFSGSGTTNICADSLNVKSYGFEGHPFIARIAQAKQYWKLNIKDLEDAANEVLSDAMSDYSSHHTSYNEDTLLNKCYTYESFDKLNRLKNSFEKLQTDDPIWEIVKLSITSILRVCSHVGTAQWQYILPNKTKTRVLDPYIAYQKKIELVKEDMIYATSSGWQSRSVIKYHDVRKEFSIEKCNLLISSPPYPNNFDYADATRLEMTFWGEISGWKDLKQTIRPSLLRSCSQHSASDKINLEEIVNEPLLSPIKEELIETTHMLDIIRHSKGGKKTYHTMVAAYFLDLAKILKNIRSNMHNDSRICLVIGDSAPYGIHVPVEKWLGKLALSTGFSNYHFEKIRDRNIKWKNRTHNVLLHEGRLWIKG